jgi:hypothetical protein
LAKTAPIPDNLNVTPPTLEVLLQSPLTSVGVYGETVITIVHTELTAEALYASRAAYDKICAKHPLGTVSLTIVHPGIKLPDASMRNLASDIMVQTKSRTRSVARVFFGDGFWLSTVRSVLTAIELMRPYDTPRRTFGTLEPATQWLAKSIQESAPWALRLNTAIHMLEGSRDSRSQAM